jgi:Periplasmic binding protein
LANAQAADDHVKIGVLTDMNGPYAAITSKGSVAAAELAIEDFGGKALGKSVELVVADHMQSPTSAQASPEDGTTMRGSMPSSMAAAHPLLWQSWKSRNHATRSLHSQELFRLT